MDAELWLEMEQEEPVIKNERKRILSKLIHTPLMTFNQLWSKQGESNKFAYHLKVLEKDNLIEKTEHGYQLTTKGKEYVVYLEGNTADELKFPLVIVSIIIMDDEKILMLKRTREPFYGYWGYHGGKLKFTDYILDSAKDSIQRETGLECDVELKGLLSMKTFVDDHQGFNHQHFVIKATNPKGALIEKTEKGENLWVPRDDVNTMKIFPNSLKFLEIVESDHFRWIEADRFQDGAAFTGIDVKKDKVL